MTKLILDTDIDTDCDDAGALAVLHALAGRQAVELLGVICSVPVPWCVPCVRAINAWYGRPNIPVAGVNIPDWNTNPAYDAYRQHHRQYTHDGTHITYNRHIGERWLAGRDPEVTPDAVQLYRRLLAAQPDAGVTICAIGTLTALAQLLRSTADAISPLSGRELVKRKVRSLVSMAVVDSPSGREPFNWSMDFPSAAHVVRHWPTRITVSPWGQTVLTGARLMACSPEDHPVATAYRMFLGSTQANRPSWDQLAAIYAALGPGELFHEHMGLGLELDLVTGQHQWLDRGAPDRAYILPNVTDSALATVIEDLMITPGQNSRQGQAVP